MELVKCLPRHLAIDLGDAPTRSFSRSRHRFVAISNCDGRIRGCCFCGRRP
jgi:hypothetical protein